MKVIKRNGDLVEFDYSKIIKALKAAYAESNIPFEVLPEYEETLVKAILKTDSDTLNVEDIQDLVEQYLMTAGELPVLKAFILYREKHKEARFITNRIDYMKRYADSMENAASSSETDANANVQIKNVSNLEGEVYKITNRTIQRKRMKDKLKELFPEVYKQYEIDLNHHIIYAHDESSTPTLKNYCEAVSLYPLVMNGTGDMDGLGTKPPTNLSSFCGQLINLTFLLSAQCKGAVAFGEFFNFFDYFCVKEWGSDYHTKLDEYSDAESCLNRKTIKDRIYQSFQNIVYSWNQPAGNRGFQSPFINISYYDSNYWHALFNDFRFPDGSSSSWERVSVIQKLFMQWFNKERTKTLLTFPVESMSLLSDGKDIIDQDYKQFTAQMLSEGHSFFIYISQNPNALASCCRLSNEIEENVFSFTTGLSGVMTGSCNVYTLNLNRIVQDYTKLVEQAGLGGYVWDKGEGLKEYLITILDRVYKYHIAFKTMLYEVEEKGMLTSSTAGYINMSKLFSTVGVNGINEAAEFLGIECSYNPEYSAFCQLITSTIMQENKKHNSAKFKFNQEFVPAESLGAKNYQWDLEEGYWVPSHRVLYNSYFYIAHDDTSVLDKFRLHGKEFTSSLDGGVGLHANLQEHLSKEQYLKLIDFAIKKGTSYFTFNVPNTQCDDCNTIFKQPLEVCPKCGSHNMTQWTRVIGFLRPIKGFSKERYIEALKRTYTGPTEFTEI